MGQDERKNVQCHKFYLLRREVHKSALYSIVNDGVANTMK